MRRALGTLLAVLALLLAASPATAGMVANDRALRLALDPDRPRTIKGLSASEAETASAPGIFLSRDPSGYADSVNLYAFAANDPVNHRDPTGERLPRQCLEPAPEPSKLNPGDWYEWYKIQGICQRAQEAGRAAVNLARSQSDRVAGNVNERNQLNQIAQLDHRGLTIDQELEIYDRAETAYFTSESVAWDWGEQEAMMGVAKRVLPWIGVGMAIAAKRVNLPAWSKVIVDMAHILERHIPGAPYSSGRTVFPGTMSERGIMSAIRDAYMSSTKVAVQGERVLLRGWGAGMEIEMWFNKATNVIETAYPVGK